METLVRKLHSFHPDDFVSEVSRRVIEELNGISEDENLFRRIAEVYTIGFSTIDLMTEDCATDLVDRALEEPDQLIAMLAAYLEGGGENQTLRQLYHSYPSIFTNRSTTGQSLTE